MKKIAKKFLDKLDLIYTKEELEIVKSGFNTEKRPTVFRINTTKSNFEEIEKNLAENKLEIKKIPYLTNAYTLLN